MMEIPARKNEQTGLRVSKGKLLTVLVEKALWKKLSPEEIRLYFLLIIFADEEKGGGRLAREDVERCLGKDFYSNRLEKASCSLKRLHLAKIDYLPEESTIGFKLF